jgi:hypothetical protein
MVQQVESFVFTSLPKSAMHRSSLPKFRFQMRCMSILISACNAVHLHPTATLFVN